MDNIERDFNGRILPTRTIPQNKALHVFFKLLCDELNDAGLDQRTVLKPSVDIPWTPKTVKEQLWRPIQKAYSEKESTKKINTAEVTMIHNILMKHLGERFGIFVPFPRKRK